MTKKISQQPFLKIAAALGERVRNGKYPPGTAIPSRGELMSEFGAARATIDRAIRHLASTGLVVSRHGAGTFAASPDTGKYRIACIGGDLEIHSVMPAEFQIQVLSPEDFRNRSEWRKLYAFDGAIFIYPENFTMELIEAASADFPLVVVNRSPAFAPFVSTDFRGTYHDLTAERIRANPGADVVFLKSFVDSLALKYRLEGFLDACREEKRFYEILEMSSDFSENLGILERRLSFEKPLILVSDALRNTGCVMRWAADKNPQWGTRLFYSDFDNDYPPDVWGIPVTSFLQDSAGLARRGGEMLLEMLETGKKVSSVLIPPLRRNGLT